MATMTISYDEHNNVMLHIIEAMLAAGAKIEKCSSNAELQMEKESLTTAFDDLHAGKSKRTHENSSHIVSIDNVSDTYFHQIVKK